MNPSTLHPHLQNVFLLTEADMKTLCSIAKANPRHKEWGHMRLYLQRQVEAIALGRYGSMEALQEARQQALRTRVDRRLKKRDREDNQDRIEDEEREVRGFVRKRCGVSWVGALIL